MLITKKMLVVLTLVGALVGAGIGSLVTHSAESSTAANSSYQTKTANASYDTSQTANNKTPEQIANDNSAQFKTSAEQTAYRQGFDDGYAGCVSARNGRSYTETAAYRAPVRRYYNGRRAYYDYGPSRTYYDYSQPRGRSFWQKHRDKLTMAIGTGSGALIGGLVGGKKGAGIGALAGLGGSALYTYKLRHRARRY